VQMIQTAHFGYGFHANHSSFLPANPAGYQVVNLHAVFHPILATFARCLTVRLDQLKYTLIYIIQHDRMILHRHYSTIITI
ncbi:hypothetical protein, partial [Acidithiobacillus albertensis]|uniref:hypothetical protein n=1 Tax=Acidithiobacillus albertensis TaxID=119978 RepID=UPI000B076337